MLELKLKFPNHFTEVSKKLISSLLKLDPLKRLGKKGFVEL